MKKLPIILIFLFIVFGIVYFMRDGIMSLFFVAQEPVGVSEGVDSEKVGIEGSEVVLDNLDIPWEIVFLPGGEMIVTERPGNVLLVSISKERYVIDEVRHIGEGGLLGMALHPEFEDNGYLYLYMTTDNDNRVVRYRFKDGELLRDRTIIENIPMARFHNGGRIKFGPDGYLYITTGDAQNTSLSQDRNSLVGKILRITAEGLVPEDNPFGNEVYSYGHRNPQGITWDDEGRLWSTEHGPSARDELNLIKVGNNYGWPEIVGDEEREGMVTPVLHSGDDYTWAPGGAIFWDGSIFFTGLRGSAVYEVKLEGGEVVDPLIHFREDFGRIRTIKEGPDGMFYLLTNNTDGRGSPEVDDDKLIRIDPRVFRDVSNE